MFDADQQDRPVSSDQRGRRAGALTRGRSGIVRRIPAVGRASAARAIRISGGRVVQGSARCSSRMRRISPSAAGLCSEP